MEDEDLNFDMYNVYELGNFQCSIYCQVAGHLYILEINAWTPSMTVLLHPHFKHCWHNIACS